MKHFILWVCLLAPFTARSQDFVQQNWPNGNAKYEGEWNGIQRVGRHKWWHENGEKKAEIVFSEMGTPVNGFTWNERGEIMDEIKFEFLSRSDQNLEREVIDSLEGGVALIGTFPRKLASEERVPQQARVGIRYTLMLADGSVVEDNFDAGKPFRFALGKQEVIPGIETAVRSMRLYEIGLFRVPAEQAYGDELMGNIPPGSTLYFKIQLDEIKP